MTIFIMVQGTVCVPRGAHLYIKGWLPSHINVAVTANEMRVGQNSSASFFANCSPRASVPLAIMSIVAVSMRNIEGTARTL